MTLAPTSGASTPASRDAAAAATLVERFGPWWADRPNRLFAMLTLARLAALAMNGDTHARQTILEKDMHSLPGIDIRHELKMCELALNTFFSTSLAGHGPGEPPYPNTLGTDAIQWAARWE